MEKTDKVDIYFQLWREPLFSGELLRILTPQDLHTLVALITYMNEEGICYPSLNTLKYATGLKERSSMCDRVQSLKRKRFRGDPIIQVGKSRGEKGSYENNVYIINPSIVSIFREHESTTSRREQQMENFRNNRDKVLNRLAMNRKGVDNNLTRTNN